MNKVNLYAVTRARLTTALTTASVALALMAGASGAAAGPSAEDWQLNRLFHPTAQQLARERQGEVFIYDGLTGRDIQRAMDQSFDRIGAMMFINVVATDDDGTDVPDDPTSRTDDDDDCG